MAKQTINVGTFPNDRTGDKLRVAGQKINANFEELYNRTPVSVKDYGAVGDGETDDTAAIQAAIDANPGAAIYLPSGKYIVSNVLWVKTDYTALIGDSITSTIIEQVTPDMDSVRFAPYHYWQDTPEGENDRIIYTGIRNILIAHAETAWSANTDKDKAGLAFIQCRKFFVQSVEVADAAMGLLLAGAQFGTFTQFFTNSAKGDYLGADSCLVKIIQGYRPTQSAINTWVIDMAQIQMGLGKAANRDYCLYIEKSDYMRVQTAVVRGGNIAAICLNAKESITELSFSATWLDDNNPNLYRVYIPANASGKAIRVTFDEGCRSWSDPVDNDPLISHIYSRNVNLFNLTWAGKDLIGDGNLSGIDIEGDATKTNVHIRTTFRALGDRLTGDESAQIRVKNVLTLNVTDCIFTAVLSDKILRLEGTIGSLNVSGCTNNSNKKDIDNQATIAQINLNGNASKYATELEGSWKGRHILFTPTLRFSTPGTTPPAYTLQKGFISITNNLAFISIVLTLSSKGDGTGTFMIEGYDVEQIEPTILLARLSAAAAALNSPVTGLIRLEAGTSARVIEVYKTLDGASILLTHADIENKTSIRITGSFILKL